MRYLTKSRFKLGVECPRKLFYSGKAEYRNTKQDDTFLQALADGGFQVGELAKRLYPGGVEITAKGNADALAATAELLQRENVILFEPAIAYGNLLVRVDVLIKCKSSLKVIEVKSKSFRSDDPQIEGKKGLKAEFKPYIEDIAFQAYVVRSAFPNSRVTSFLLLPDKSLQARVDQMNQLFKVERSGKQVRIISDPRADSLTVEEALLCELNVDPYIDLVHQHGLTYPGGAAGLADASRQWAEAYASEGAVDGRYMPEEAVGPGDRIELTDQSGVINQAISDAKAQERAWPTVQYLWDGHPILEWFADRASTFFPEHAAPVAPLTGRLPQGEVAVILHGAIPNENGAPVVDQWAAVICSPEGTVRHIFSRYVELGSGGDLLDELRVHGIRTKRHIRKDGLVRGDIPFTRGSLFHLLKNRVYRGEIVHKDTAYPGEHEAIIDAGLWESVQQRIVENTVDRKLRRKARESSLLSGIIFDGHGRKMCPSHTVRKAKRYRYYVTHPDKVIDDTPQWRRSAFDIEKRVIGTLVDYLEDQQAIRKLVGSSDARKLATAITRCQRAADQIRTSTFHRRTKVPALVARVDLGDDQIGISLSDKGFADLVGRPIDAEPLPRLNVLVARVRRGNEVKLILTDGATTEADDTLVSLMREAMAARNELLAESHRGICQLASATGRCSKRMTRLVRLSWLAPEIVDAILAGRQPNGLTARLLLSADLPMDWAGQKAALGF